MEFKRATLDEDTVKQLIELSYIWEKEDITFGLRHNERSDLEEICYIAVDNGKIIGYTFGHYYYNEEYLTYGNVGDKFFSISELYVLPDYRNQGIGRKLFQLIEKEAKENAVCITLSTATKDYRRVLKFYNEAAGMSVHSSFLFKKTK